MFFHSTCIFAILTSFVVSLLSMRTCPVRLVKETIKVIKDSKRIPKKMYWGIAIFSGLIGAVAVFIHLH